MIKQMFLLAAILCNATLLYAAADGKNDLLANLIPKVEVIDLGDACSNHYKASSMNCVTYFYKDIQVGYIAYRVYSKQEKCAFIDALEVKEQFRSLGLGSYILKQAIQNLKNDGYDRVRLKATPDYKPMLERLIAFYEKFGFRVLKVKGVRALMEASL